MIVCKSLKEARAVDGVVHIEVLPEDAGAIAYQFGDELPDHCKSDAELGLQPQPDRISELLALNDRQWKKLLDFART